MKASLEWLNAFVPAGLDAKAMRDLLTAHTATVEDVAPLRTDLAPIVVARVVEATRHPDSDHLWVTQVDAGRDQTFEVVCGAANVTAGKLYPFAPLGTVMPNGMTIERRKIRGIASNGMLCSARELGLGEDHAGILELNLDAAPGTPLLDAMPVGDMQLEVDVGANRPDLLSHLGLAREISAVTGVALRVPDLPGVADAAAVKPHRAGQSGSAAGIAVSIAPETRARRYMAAVVRGVRVAPSPDWLVQRLVAVGSRSVNNVVDATNYVLHELGQPVHAFDLARLHGEVTVRMARAGEKLVTLDGAERMLPASAVVIADAQGAQALAGIMGGRDSEVTDSTHDLFIEVASFDPAHTRAARKALGLSTDASYRFERGVDPELAAQALDRVARLILSMAGGSVDAAIDLYPAPPTSRDIVLRPERLRQVLGADVPEKDARTYLERAGFAVKRASGSGMRVSVPSWRADVHDEIDLVEEVARFHGYDRFPVEIRPFRPTTTTDHPLWSASARVREVGVALGLMEVRPLPFVAGDDATHVRVANPLSENEAYLRTSLLETLARRAEFNLAQRTPDIRMFEIGSAFERVTSADAAALPREEVRVAALVMGRRRPVHFTEPEPPHMDEWDARGIAQRLAEAAHPSASVELLPGGPGTLWTVQADGRPVGTVRHQPLDAPVWAAPAFGVEILLGEMATRPAAPPGQHDYQPDSAPHRPPARRFAGLPATPPAEFDLALLVPSGITAADVEQAIRRSSGELLERLELFDVYQGDGIEAGLRSLAWRLTFRHPERTLRDKEIDGRRRRILDVLREELNVRQRTS